MICPDVLAYYPKGTPQKTSNPAHVYGINPQGLRAVVLSSHFVVYASPRELGMESINCFVIGCLYLTIQSSNLSLELILRSNMAAFCVALIRS